MSKGKKAGIIVACLALIGAAIGVYFGFFSNRAPVIADDEPPEILNYGVPSNVLRGEEFRPWAEVVDDTGIESVILQIEGIGNYVLENTESNLWETPEEISIPTEAAQGSYGYSLIATDSRGQETAKQGTIIACFTADTLILMADGSFKPIVDIKEDEQVLSFDFETNSLSNNKVIGLYEFEADSYLLINSNLKVTGKHPFAVGFDTWKEAGKLEIGDKVLGLKDIEIISIVEVFETTSVFDLAVDGTHNYFVSDGIEVFLVHNKGGGSFCLLNDSLVLVESNELAKIQDLSVGDSIKSVDLESNSIVNTTITRIVKEHARESYYSINNELFITNDHPVLALRNDALEWVRTENLKIGDRIKASIGFTEIRNIEYINQFAITVYLETEIGNFIVRAGNNDYVVKSNYPQTFAVGEVGDEVLGLKDIEIISIVEVFETTSVFDLAVDGTHNYFVSDGIEVFLVHNKGGGS